MNLGKEDTLVILLSTWDRSRDSKAKRNLSKHMWRTPVCWRNIGMVSISEILISLQISKLNELTRNSMMIWVVWPIYMNENCCMRLSAFIGKLMSLFITASDYFKLPFLAGRYSMVSIKSTVHSACGAYFIAKIQFV